jgi:hypothetical protein
VRLDQVTAARRRSARSIHSRLRAWVAASTTGGATPARCACTHRLAHRHQRSPGRSPGKPNSGRGVTRSLPTPVLNRRNSAVTTAQTVCTPASSASVLQQPSRWNPVIGSVPQLCSSPPRTLRATSRYCHHHGTRRSASPPPDDPPAKNERDRRHPTARPARRTAPRASAGRITWAVFGHPTGSGCRPSRKCQQNSRRRPGHLYVERLMCSCRTPRPTGNGRRPLQGGVG